LRRFVTSQAASQRAACALEWLASLSSVDDRHLVIKALDMALRRRCRELGCCTTLTRAARTRAKTTGASLQGAA
jgi:hypothetical protein